MLTATGIEGSLVYALSAPIRNTINRDGAATVLLDLLPDRTLTQIASALARPRGSQSMAKHLHRQLKLDGVKAALLRELTDATTFQAQALAAAIKALPIRLVRPRPLDEAISSAGGVPFEELDEGLMLRRLPGVFCAGEMLDWEAPTGGYLLTACFASGRAAAEACCAGCVPTCRQTRRAERCAAGHWPATSSSRYGLRCARRACRRRSG